MFSWSKGGRGYPGQRIAGATSTTTTTTTTSSSPAVAQTIQGTIRPPKAFSRKAHLESYLTDATLARSTRKVSKDDTTYDTVFQTTQGNALILRVFLPLVNDEPPQMTMVGVRATHAWLDQRMKVTGYPPLENLSSWRLARISLGQAVHEVVQHFQLRPPQLLEITDKGLRKLQSNLSPPPPQTTTNQSSETTAAPPSYHTIQQNAPQQQAPSPEVQLPRIPNRFALLDDMNRDELQHLLDNEIEFKGFVHSLDIYRDLQTKRADLVQSNETKAMALLEREQDYMALYQSTAELQTAFKAKLDEFDSLSREQDGFMEPQLNYTHVVAALSKAKRQAFNESEECAAEWVEDGDDDVKQFCQQFLPLRQKMHLRAAKLERLQEQSTQKQL